MRTVLTVWCVLVLFDLFIHFQVILIAIIVACMFRKIGNKEHSDRSLPVPVTEDNNKSTKFTGTHMCIISIKLFGIFRNCQVEGFLWVLWVPPPIKLTATI